MSIQDAVAHSLQRFQENEHNPLVQALIRFIIDHHRKQLSDVVSWYIEANREDITFTVLFSDDTVCNGHISQMWTATE